LTGGGIINIRDCTSVVMAARTGNTRYSGLGIGIPENQWCCRGLWFRLPMNKK
jgi:hypothetical protein